MTPQNTRAICGTAMIITAVAVKNLAGGGIEILGMTLIGLMLLMISLAPPAPPQEGGYSHSNYR